VRAPLDLGLYLVADVRVCAERGVQATVAAAVTGGVTAVQLRDRAASTRSMYESARGLLEVLAGTGIPLIVNDRLDVALAAGAAGVHLGQSDLPPAEARRIAGADLVIGWSVTDEAQAQQAAAMPAGTVDYLGAGPVFATATKPDAAQPIGIDRLRGIVTRSTLPIVAIGGIDPGNAGAVGTTGVAGIAVVSAICAAPDPAAAAGELVAAAWPAGEDASQAPAGRGLRPAPAGLRAPTADMRGRARS
jgi:thiamine-phosphate pyrophosphorylase